jgi:hypothetical protein
MDLKPFVGKKVLLQFKPQAAYAVVTSMEDQLSPLLMKGPEGTAQPVIVPYIDGRIVEEGGAIFLVYNDQAAPRGKRRELRVSVSPDLIGFVTVRGEEQTAASVILAP